MIKILTGVEEKYPNLWNTRRWKCIKHVAYCGDSQFKTFENEQGEQIGLGISNYRDLVDVISICGVPIQGVRVSKMHDMDAALDDLLEKYRNQCRIKMSRGRGQLRSKMFQY